MKIQLNGRFEDISTFRTTLQAMIESWNLCSSSGRCAGSGDLKCEADYFKGTVKKRVKWSRYRSGVAQRVGRVIDLLFHDRGTKRGWVVSSTPRPHFTPRKDPVLILQEVGWVWTGGKSRPHRDSIPDRPARSSVAILTELPGPLNGTVPTCN